MFRRKKTGPESKHPAEIPIPAGSRIYTSDSPKVVVAHLKSAVNKGAVCEALSQWEVWLGVGSSAEQKKALSLRLCKRCAAGDKVKEKPGGFQ